MHADKISVQQTNILFCSLSHRTNICGSAGQSHGDSHRLLE